ncbi:Rrf2 family transcriptional regulator [Hydrogenophaga sp. 2FB]|uniref:Rrf2 family transcriptional regulator n=1 Tax=Hydrogenophaga sp. 2FB TaxID=2502187 RepID=UPI0010F99444|nr:Rrf2 family transcriptional regulator [Hydrogenophaga sp. 2FB]
MKIDSKLSSILHLLLHMAHSERPMTSEALAACMPGSNPVVVRRTLAGLREAGFVSSERGHGGGWVLACDLRNVTLRDVYDAVGAPAVFAMGHRTDNPQCLVEQAVNAALDGALRDAEALLVQRLGSVTLAVLSADFNRRFAERPHDRSHHHAHGHHPQPE